MTKICTKCKREKTLDNFYKNKSCRYGVMARCKECTKQAAKELKFRKKIVVTEKICGHCKIKKPISEFHKLASRIDGHHPNCKECKNRHRWTPRGKYGAYKMAASQRNIKFDISFEEFKSFWKKPCEYCGSEIKTIGLDRINSYFGYSIQNIKSCCKKCNYMKKDYSVEEWFEHMIKVLSYNERTKENESE